MQFNVDGCSATVTTGFGGLMTLLFVTLVSLYTIQTLRMMVMRTGTLFISSTQIIDVDSEELMQQPLADGELFKGSIMMSDFDDSFNMMIGSTDLSIDMLNNRFINFKV